jgi:hypothetical protein
VFRRADFVARRPSWVGTISADIPPPPDILSRVKALLREQIQAWRGEIPPRTWAWIRRQPAAKAYYDVLGGR